MRTTSRLAVTAAVLAASAAATAAPASAAPSPQAIWNMDSLPTMFDSASAGGANNGTTRAITSGGAGRYLFNGTTSLATVPDAANLDPGTATIRLTARVQFTQRPAVGGTYDIVRKGVTTTAGGDYKMEIYARSATVAVAACSFKDAKGVSGQSFGTVDLASTAFQTITCTKTPTSIQVVAGGQTRTSTKALGAISNAAPVYVGGKGDGTDVFRGVMDFVKIEIG